MRPVSPGRMAAGDERLLYGPGDVVVTDLDRPSGYEGRGVGESVAVYLPRPVIDGLTYREGLNAVGIEGGVATNVIPDACVVTVNYRYAPDRSPQEALAHLEELFHGYPLDVVDNAHGALPGLQHPAAQAFLAATGAVPRPKFGWTDVSRFSALGVPAVNFGPGDPALAHTRGEYVPVEHLQKCEAEMLSWLR